MDGCTTKKSRQTTKTRPRNTKNANKVEPTVEPIPASNTNSPPNKSAAMETRVPQVTPLGENNTVIEISDGEADNWEEVQVTGEEKDNREEEVQVIGEENIADEQVEAQIEAALVWAMNKYVDPTSGDENAEPNSITRKRGKENESPLVRQDPIIDTVKAAKSTMVSPEKKVRKTSTSPFSKSKKSGSANSAGKIEREPGSAFT